jgi:hypothetical protein
LDRPVPETATCDRARPHRGHDERNWSGGRDEVFIGVVPWRKDDGD